MTSPTVEHYMETPNQEMELDHLSIVDQGHPVAAKK